jgi:hypothetical protein
MPRQQAPLTLTLFIILEWPRARLSHVHERDVFEVIAGDVRLNHSDAIPVLPCADSQEQIRVDDSTVPNTVRLQCR